MKRTIKNGSRAVKQTTGETLTEFSAEIDCTEMTDRNYIHMAVEHGTENDSNTSCLYLDRIDFIY